VLLGSPASSPTTLFFLGALARLPASRTSLIIALNPVRDDLGASLLHGRTHERTPLVRRGRGAGRRVDRRVARRRARSVFRAVASAMLLMFGGVCSWAALHAHRPPRA